MTIDGFCGSCGRALESARRIPVAEYVDHLGLVRRWWAVLCDECAQSEVAVERERMRAQMLIPRIAAPNRGGRP